MVDIDPKKEQESDTIKQERLIKSLEEWLYHPNEFPQINMQSSSTTLHSDFFKNALYFEVLFSFLFNPIKYKLIAQPVKFKIIIMKENVSFSLNR